MKYRIEKEKGLPAYRQLYELLRADIVSGVYPYGSKLPSKRLIAEETGVSVITAEHSLALLCDEGYAASRERSGYFVAFRPSDGFASPAGSLPRPRAEEHRSPSATVDFPFSVLTKTMRRVIADRGETILEKAPEEGLPELRAAVARYLARSRGITVGADQIIIGSGSESLYRLMIDLLGHGRVYAFESPSYKKIEQIYRASGVRCAALPLGADGIDSAALWHSDADVLHITPYRSFPSGVTASASKRHEYLNWSCSRPGYLIEDDFESEFSVSRKPEETLFALSADRSGNVLYLNSFSRTISPALRTSYLVLPPALAERRRETVGYYSCAVPTFEQYLIASLLDSGEFERNINRVRRIKRRQG